MELNVQKQTAFKVAGLGEVLWDIFPDFKRPGGAPANVAYHIRQLGNTGMVLSKIGDDEPGRELRTHLRGKGLNTNYIQTDTTYPTGSVKVSFDEQNEPDYTITEDVAWDYMELNAEWERAAYELDAVSFGTLAQRSERSRKTIQNFLGQVSAKTLRVLDVNLRAPFYSRNILLNSIELCNVIKLNMDEYNLIERLAGVRELKEWLLHEMNVSIICLTKGSEGSELMTINHHYHASPVDVDTSGGDAVGVGDAFTAALIHHLLRSSDMNQVLQKANRYAGLIVTKQGAMPELKQQELLSHH